MKTKLISIAFAATVLFAPAFPVAAQSVNAPVQDQRVLVLRIQILKLQIALLQQQLAAILGSQAPAPATQTATTTIDTPAVSTGATAASTTPQGTIQAMPELTCSLTLGNEMVDTTQLPNGKRVSVPSGRFELSWYFDDGAEGELTSDHGEDGVLNASSGSRVIRTANTVTYTLTVTKPGYQTASCSVTAAHQQ